MKTNPIITLSNSGFKIANKVWAIPNTYSLTIQSNASGTASSDAMIGTQNYSTNLYAIPNEGYRFSSWNVTGGSIVDNKFIFGNVDATIEPVFEEAPPYPTDYQYLKFSYANNDAYTALNNAIAERGFTAVDSGTYIICKIPNETTYVSFGYSIGSQKYYGCEDWFLPYVTNTTGLFEWTPLTSIPDNFWGLSATQNLGRAFNCLQTQDGGLLEVKSFDGLINVEEFEYAFYENPYTLSLPTAFAPHTFEKCNHFNGCFASVTASNNMAPFAEHCNSACTASYVDKTTNLASCPDMSEFNALGWS